MAQDDVDCDPRMELVRRLQAYEQFKQAALLMDTLPRFERDVFQVSVCTDAEIKDKTWPDIELASVVVAMMGLMQRQDHMTHHHITRELLSVQDRMVLVLQHLQHEKLIEFSRLLNRHEGRMGLVVTFLAILELARQSLITITQTAAYSPVHLQAHHDG